MTTRHAMTLMIINSVLWFEEPLDWERARSVLVERIVGPFPRFSQLVHEGGVLGGPSWDDDPAFDVDNHLHRYALPAPGDQAVLQEVVGDLIVRPLDRSRPLWEMVLLEGYGGGDALLVRMHHCIADGIALARVMMSLTDLDGEPLGFAAHADGPHRSRAGTLAGLAGAAVHEAYETAVHPNHAKALALHAASDARTLSKLLLPGTETPSSLKGEQHIRHAVAWSPPVGLATIKAAGQALEATVNDVVVAAVAGAVGRLLRESDEHPERLHAMVPFNLRPLDEPLPPELGNRFGIVLLELPVGLEDPIARVRDVHSQMRAIKRSNEGALSYAVLQALGRTPVESADRVDDVGTGEIDGIVGCRGERARPDHEREDECEESRPARDVGDGTAGVLAWAPCSGSVAMSVSVYSYAGKVTVGFLTDAGRMAEPARLVEHFRSELRLIGRRARQA